MSAKIDFAALNHRVVYENNNQWRITSAALGKSVLVDADCIAGPLKGQTLNLIKSRTPSALAIRQSIGMQQYS